MTDQLTPRAPRTPLFGHHRADSLLKTKNQLHSAQAQASKPLLAMGILFAAGYLIASVFRR